MDIHALPYLKKYTDLIKAPYDIVYWNRYGEKEDCGAQHHYRLNYTISRTSKIQKLIGYISFKIFANRLLKKNRYEKIVLLSGNVGVLLKNVLTKKYKNKYLIDIRDYFMENNEKYYNAEKKVIDHSAIAVISSEGYKEFLPEHNYILVHNFPKIDREDSKRIRDIVRGRRESKGEKPIILSFIGGVRFLEQDKRILKYFGNDRRFEIRYIGVGAYNLSGYVDEQKLENVKLHDKFPPEETLKYFAETDVIINLYGNGTPLLDYALSNKLYYAALLCEPILVCPDTFMERISEAYGFGFTIDLDNPSCKEEFIKWYNDIDNNSFAKHCNKFVDKVREEEKEFYTIVTNWLNE